VAVIGMLTASWKWNLEYKSGSGIGCPGKNTIRRGPKRLKITFTAVAVPKLRPVCSLAHLMRRNQTSKIKI